MICDHNVQFISIIVMLHVSQPFWQPFWIYKHCMQIVKETWTIINDLVNKTYSTRLSYTTEFIKNGSIISGNMNIAEYFNSFFANIGPTLPKGIPKSDRHVETVLGDRVTDSIFLNPVTDDELINSVHSAKEVQRL